MRTIFTTLAPEATFAAMVISLILAALLTPLVYRKIQQWRLRRMYNREIAEVESLFGPRVARLTVFPPRKLERRWG